MPARKNTILQFWNLKVLFKLKFWFISFVEELCLKILFTIKFEREARKHWGNNNLFIIFSSFHTNVPKRLEGFRKTSQICSTKVKAIPSLFQKNLLFLIQTSWSRTQPPLCFDFESTVWGNQERTKGTCFGVQLFFRRISKLWE